MLFVPAFPSAFLTFLAPRRFANGVIVRVFFGYLHAPSVPRLRVVHDPPDAHTDRFDSPICSLSASASPWRTGHLQRQERLNDAVRIYLLRWLYFVAHTQWQV